MRLRRKRPAPSVEPDCFEAAAEVLERWATRGSRQSALYVYKREARQRQRARSGTSAPPTKRTSQSRSSETPVAAPPQPRADTISTPGPIPEPVPSEPPAQGSAAKTEDEWAYEHFAAFEKLCGNGDRIAERMEEARSYEPEDPLPDYVW